MQLPPEHPPRQWSYLKARPMVSVIVPVTGTLEDAQRRLAEFPELPTVETKVVWFLDDDPPLDLYGSYHSNLRKWQTRELNTVIAETKGDFILLVEDGCLVTQDGVRHMIQQFTDVRVGMVGQELCVDGYPHIRRGCLMMARRAYEQCGFFNRNMRSDGWNGLEICLRLQEAGYGTRQAQSSEIILGEPESQEGRSARINADYIRRRYGVKV